MLSPLKTTLSEQTFTIAPSEKLTLKNLSCQQFQMLTQRYEAERQALCCTRAMASEQIFCSLFLIHMVTFFEYVHVARNIPAKKRAILEARFLIGYFKTLFSFPRLA